MQLGDIIAMLDDDTVATEYLLGCGDVTLLLEVGEVASRFNETPGEYASGAVRRFADSAGDEDWLALVGALGRSDDPGRSCLVKMVSWSLARDKAPPAAAEHTCGCGGAGQGCHT